MSKTSNIRLSTILTPRWNTFCIYHIWNARSEKKTARCWNVCLHVEDVQYPVEHHINATKMKYILYISQVVFNIWNARSEKKATRCWNVCLHVEDVEYPVEHHVDTERHVDEVGVFRSNRLKHRRHAVDYLDDVHDFVVLAPEAMTIKCISCCCHRDKIH